jgi:hypothetical protein
MMAPGPLELLFGSKVKRTVESSEVVEGHTRKAEKVVGRRYNDRVQGSGVQELNGVPVKIISHHPSGATFTDKALLSPPDKCTRSIKRPATIPMAKCRR